MAWDALHCSSQDSTQAIRETQEICDSQPLDISVNKDKVWGRLLSVCQNSRVIDLVNDTCSFGRGDVDFRFTEDCIHPKLLPVLSKIHFVISRVKMESDYVIIIEDKSQNGTFINQEQIGKGNKKSLRNNDEIALAQANRRVFVFHDCLKNEDSDYPEEVNKKYVIMRKIGDGAYGQVRLAYTEGSFNRVAVKIMKKSKLSGEKSAVEQINNEIELLRSLDHPCIIRMLDFMESPERMFLIMELAEGGELFERITTNGQLSEPITKLYFYQIVNAVTYLHKMKITHRDIKPENILLATDDEFTRLKLSDFGLSKLAGDVSCMTTFCGTKLYIAPELLVAEERSYTKKVDIWSLGVVMFVCLVGYIPFSGKTENDKLLNIMRGNYSMRNPKWNGVSKEAKELIRKLLVVDPQKRLSAEEILQHEWFKDETLLKRVKDLFAEEAPTFSRKRPLSADEMAVAKTPKLIECQLTEITKV